MKKQLHRANLIKRFLLIFTFIAMMACAAFAQSPFIDNTPGTTTWTVPYGVTSITVETWGAGGTGGGSSGSGGGGGGGGGGYNTTTMSVTYGTVYSYTVGAGVAGTSGAGSTGGASSFNSGTTANGGVGGVAGGAGTYGAGGAGGTGSKTGGTGGTGSSPNTGGGGGSAGNGSNGGNGAAPTAGTAGTAGSGTAGATGATGVSANGNGAAGTVPGSGGSGGKSSGILGGAGANGQVKITYSQPCTAPPAQPTSLTLSSVATTSIAGSFTAASYTDGYLVVMTTTSSAPTNPSNNTTYVAGASGLGGTIIYSGALTTFTASSLTAHTQYWFWVYGFNNSPCTGGITYLTTSPISANGYTLCSAPANSPTSLTFPTVTYNSISGSYTAGAGTDGYLVIRMTSNTAVTLPTNGVTYTVGSSALGGTVDQAGSGTTFTSSGLSANTQYWYTIFSMNFTTCYGPVYKTGAPLKANTTTDLTPCVAPTAQPTSLVLTGASTTSVGGSFTAEPSAYGYLVVRTTTSSAPTNPVDGTTYTAGASSLGGLIIYAGTSTSFTSTGLTANTPYYYWVYSYNDVTCSGGIKYYTPSPLSGVGYTACVSPTAQPTALVLTAYPTSLVGSFHASLSADGYLVIRMTTNANPTNPVNGTIYTLGASALGGTVAYVGSLADFTDAGLSSSTQYWYTIFAYNNNNCLTIAYRTGAPLKNNSTTLAAYCAAPSAQPTSLVLTPAATAMAGSFTSSASATGYLVVYTNTSTAPTSPVDGITYTAGAAALGGTIVSSTNTTTFNATGLSGYTQYWFWVFGYNNTGCTSGPKYYTVSPLSNNSYTACVAPTQPTSLSLTPTPTTIAGSFTPSVNADAYLVVRMSTSANPTNPTNGTTYTAGASALGGYIESAGTATSFTSTGLTNNTQYWYTIFAYDYNSCATVAYQTTAPLKANTTTLLAPCVAPTAQPTTLILTPAATSIAGSFTASGSADGYLVVRTTTSSAPTNPTDVTTYTAGASALGGLIIYSGSSTSFSSTSLTAHQQYWYWVYGYNNSCSGGPLYYTVSPLTGNSYTTCAAPAAQATSGSLTPSSYTMAGSFTASGSADSYLVIRMTTNAAVTNPTNGTTYTVGASALGGTVDMAGAGTSWTSTGLAASTGYWYTIFAYNASTCVTPAYYITTPLNVNSTTSAAPCVAPSAQPTSLVLTPAATSISGSFTADVNTEKYLVVVTTTSSAPSSPVTGTTYTAGTSALGGTIVYAGTLTTFTTGVLSANTQYWLWVYGYNSTCGGGPRYLTTSPLSGNSYTACSAPAAQPTSLVLTPATNSITASFTASAATGYLVIRMTSVTAPTNPTNGTTYTVGTSALGGVVDMAGAGTSFTSSSLSANTHYWYTVFAYNFTNCAVIAYKTATPLTNNATTNMAACATPAAQPTSLVFTPASTAIAGAFTAASGTDGYLVVRTLTSSTPTSPVDGTTYTAGTSVLGGLIISAGATTSFNSTSLSANTQYWYWIYSYNNVCTGTIKYKSTSPLTGSSYTTCTAPSAQPTVLTLTPSSYSIAGSFTASASAQSYLVIRMTTNTTVTLPTNGTTYTVGQSALGGTVDMAGAGTSWTSSGLTGTTQYWYTIFAYNNNTCSTVAYYTASPLKGNTTTLTAPCVAPAAQPTSLVAGTTYSESLSASFTATTADGYLVVRTTTSSAPTNPVTGTTYTSGTSALGGYIEVAGTATSWTSTSLTAGTTYWYWVYAYNKTACANIAYKTASPLTTSITTAAVGVWTNTCTLTTSGTATYNYSTLTWGLGHTPTSSETAEIVLNVSTAVDDVISINLDLSTSVYGFKMRNISPAGTVHILQTNGSSKITIANDMYLSCTGGSKWDRCVYANIDTTIINGNLILGSTTPGATEGHSAIGSTGSTAGQTYILYGNMTFNKKGYTTDEHAVFIFDKAGTQYVYNNTTVTDTIQPVLFETLYIGKTNATTVIFGGTQYDGYIENVRAGGVTIGVNSTLDLPGYYNLNKFSGGFAEPFTLLSGAKLRLGGDKGLDVSGATVGVTGSNFPANFDTYPFNANSTVEYYGGNSITQTIYNTPTYGKLVINNGSGSGRAAKITTGAITASTSIDINALADVTLGSTVSSAGPFNVNATGGLYCATNTVSGAGAFTLASTGYLGLGSPQGITSGSTASGNIQMTGGRSFSTGGNYIYNGTATQVTGNGLPATCNDLTIDNATTVTATAGTNATGIAKLKQGTFDIGTNLLKVSGTGTLTSTGGLMKANVGALELAGTSGTAQSIDGSWFVGKNISSLINSNTTGITLAATANDTLLISSSLLYGTGTTNSTITTNNNLTLLSRDSSTARFGQVVTGSGNTITGNVNVERYVRSGRKWRLLAWPTTSTQTARQAWMENNSTANANGTPGYGVIVTDNLSTWSANGFDSKSVSGPSVKYYDPATATFIGIPNTTSFQMNGQSAYYNYVRGDRSCVPSPVTVSTTNLRTTGTLKTGNQAFSIPAGKYAAIGNPYASAVDLRSIDTTNTTQVFYLWDPLLTGTYGLGAYQTLYVSGAGYKILPGGGSYTALNTFVDTLESGSGFFVKAKSTGSATVTFKESAKTIGLRTQNRLPVNMPTISPLLSIVNGGVATLADGAMAAFDAAYSNAVDDDDITKMLNTGENVSFKRAGVLLAIERRQNITSNDTLFLNISGTTTHLYQWDITSEYLADPQRTAFLRDNYLGRDTPLNLSGVTTVQFNTNNTPGTYANNRFMIIFQQAAVVPVTFTSITATRNADKTVTVKWNTENEINMQEYKVEHSNDGTHFAEIGSQQPSANTGGSAGYSFIDTHATSTNNYYRIKGISLNGQDKYTAIVRVGALTATASADIYPNPVTDNTVNLRLENQPKGSYGLTITDKAGRVLHTETLQVNNDNMVRMINPGSKPAPGSYQLSLVDESGKITTIPFIIQ